MPPLPPQAAKYRIEHIVRRRTLTIGHRAMMHGGTRSKRSGEHSGGHGKGSLSFGDLAAVMECANAMKLWAVDEILMHIDKHGDEI